MEISRSRGHIPELQAKVDERVAKQRLASLRAVAAIEGIEGSSLTGERQRQILSDSQAIGTFNADTMWVSALLSLANNGQISEETVLAIWRIREHLGSEMKDIQGNLAQE